MTDWNDTQSENPVGRAPCGFLRFLGHILDIFPCGQWWGGNRWTDRIARFTLIRPLSVFTEWVRCRRAIACSYNILIECWLGQIRIVGKAPPILVPGGVLAWFRFNVTQRQRSVGEDPIRGDRQTIVHGQVRVRVTLVGIQTPEFIVERRVQALVGIPTPDFIVEKYVGAHRRTRECAKADEGNKRVVKHDDAGSWTGLASHASGLTKVIWFTNPRSPENRPVIWCKIFGQEIKPRT
jgi:hypothetical protein